MASQEKGGGSGAPTFPVAASMSSVIPPLAPALGGGGAGAGGGNLSSLLAKLLNGQQQLPPLVAPAVGGRGGGGNPPSNNMSLRIVEHMRNPPAVPKRAAAAAAAPPPPLPATAAAASAPPAASAASSPLGASLEPAKKTSPQQQQQQQQDPPGAPPPAPAYPDTFLAMKQHKDHPLRMKLEWDEIERAVEIKEAIQNTPGLDYIGDFWCAQYALICKDDGGDVVMEEVIERAEALQVFRRQYRIGDPTYQEGRRALRKFATLCPNYFLAFFYDANRGIYTVIENLANFSAENFSPQDRKDFMVGAYYFMLLSYPDFQAIHKGLNIKVDCKEMGWSKRHNMKLIHKGAEELFSFLPVDPLCVKFYNTGVAGAVFNTMQRTMMNLFSEEIAKKHKIGFTYLDGLDSVFLVPDAAASQERALQNMEESLRLRLENERRFSLAKENWESISPFTDDMVEAVGDARRL